MQDAVVAGPVAAPSDEAQDDAAADGLSLSARAKNLLQEHKQVFRETVAHARCFHSQS